MQDLTSELHLYQTPMYKGSDGAWYTTFSDAIQHSDERLFWDISAVLSIISYGYVCGNRTLIKGVTRRPWLSKLESNNQYVLSNIPAHGVVYKDVSEIAKHLRKLLYDEADRVCQDRKEIYILLSGGLDSRIVAGTVARLYEEGKLLCKPCAVTWGIDNCRDVAYGRKVAEILGFEWIHIGIDSEDLLRNIELTASLGCLFSPTHLHRMSWFKGVSREALVLSGSYGDSVGRAEFSGTHLLELNYLSPWNRFDLIRRELCPVALKDINAELEDLRKRAPGEPKYVICEHEMQGQYMRGLIAQAMSVIDDYCTLYQMFTDPNVYAYMWSIHPSLRDDSIYACLLEKLNEKLARLPWARTNRSLAGNTVGSKKNLRKSFQSYSTWVSGPVYKKLAGYVDPNWYADTGIFDIKKITELCQRIEYGSQGVKQQRFRLYREAWVWLASFRMFSDCCRELGTQVELDSSDIVENPEKLDGISQDTRSRLRQIVSGSETFQVCRKKVRRYLVKRAALKEFPPQILK